MASADIEHARVVFESTLYEFIMKTPGGKTSFDALAELPFDTQGSLLNKNDIVVSALTRLSMINLIEWDRRTDEVRDAYKPMR